MGDVYNAIMDASKSIIFDSKSLVALVNDEQSEEAVLSASQVAEQNLSRLVDLAKSSVSLSSLNKEAQEYLLDGVKAVDDNINDLISASLVSLKF